jgi:hypothetical protein
VHMKSDPGLDGFGPVSIFSALYSLSGFTVTNTHDELMGHPHPHLGYRMHYASKCSPISIDISGFSKVFPGC